MNLEKILDKAIDIGRGAWKWVTSFTKSQKKAVAMGAGVIGFAAIAGGPLLQYAFGGILINSLFWMLVTDSSRMMNFMQKYGATLDIILTIGSFFTGGATLGGWLTNLMGTGFFTLYRMFFAEAIEDPEPTWVDRVIDKVSSKFNEFSTSGAEEGSKTCPSMA